ncbi:hypothetical protein [Glycomyces albidus]|uniref:Uncharacterized protein n=1 Tax=Glycomyces albidus TaxID=2656774 RepID=A0A6L5G348_9ACTN|nr:hypothetical protein [Glycomyces albidus]MQM24297.1 hypothetical protein [Glycomyces albidus]MQM24304.1 hypothetical protein [Glycomyces albidus]
MAANTSKTARASVKAGQGKGTAGLSVLGEFKYLIPLNGGKHVYLRNLTTGKTLHLATGSEAFTEALKGLAAAGHGEKLKAEIEGLAAKLPEQGWDTTLKNLEEAGVFSAEAVAA